MDAETSRAVSAEFLGTLVFCFLANTSSTALGVGIAYAVSSAEANILIDLWNLFSSL